MAWSWRGLLRQRPRLVVYYDEAYRLPLSGLEGAGGLEPRRADYALWYLLERRWLRPRDVARPQPIGFGELARIHTQGYLESLSDREVLGRIFAVDPSDVPVDELLGASRLACGATLEGARAALSRRGPVLNLVGGFHHAAPDRGGGFCVFNDVAVAIAALRSEGFQGQISVLDLDAHPPDGTADCLRSDPRVWLGSLSGSDWGPLEGVHELRLPEGSGDDAYLAALRTLLLAMPDPVLTFVLAGGDVLAGDRLGRLGLSLEGASRRDAWVRRRLGREASVWLPAGGYRPDAWKVLVGTAAVLLGKARPRIPDAFDPLAARFAGISRVLSEDRLQEEDELTLEDLEGELRGRRRDRRLLGYYSVQGIEYALHRYCVLQQIERLGYSSPRVDVSATTEGTGDRLRLLARSGGEEHLLVDCVLERRRIGGAEFLFVNWLSLRNPRAQFSPLRPRLPGQEVPGLGMAREVSELFGQMALRLQLSGLAFRPSWFHLAYVARHRFRFVDPARQGRFEALVRDLGPLPLLEATHAVAEGRVRMDGDPYAWEADDMVSLVAGGDTDAREIARVRDSVRFTVEPAAPGLEPSRQPP